MVKTKEQTNLESTGLQKTIALYVKGRFQLGSIASITHKGGK